MAVEEYQRGIPEYTDKTGKRFGLLCETKEDCIVDEAGVRLDQKLASMQQQIGSVSTDIAETINTIVDEKVETLTPEDIGAVPQISGNFVASAPGWHRIGVISKTKSAGNFILSISREYYSAAPETLKCLVSFANDIVETKLDVNQLSYNGYTKTFTKIRLVKDNDSSGSIYIDIYTDTQSQNGYFFDIDSLNSCGAGTEKPVLLLPETSDATFDEETQTAYECELDTTQSSVVDHARDAITEQGGVIKEGGNLTLEGGMVYVRQPSIQASGAYARGVTFLNTENKIVGGVGFHGYRSTNEPTFAYLGIGTEAPWGRDQGLIIDENGVSYKGKKLYTQDEDIGATTQKINVIKNASFHMSHDNQSAPNTLYAQGIIFHQNEDGAVEGGVVINGMNGVATEINIAMGDNPSDDGTGLTITKQAIYWKGNEIADDNGLATAASAKLLEVLNSNEINFKNLPASGALWFNHKDVSGTMGEHQSLDYRFGNGHGNTVQTAITTGKIIAGNGNTATGVNVSAFGYQNDITGYYSVGIGAGNRNRANYTLTAGYQLFNNTSAGTVLGQFNKLTAATESFLVIGNGSQESTRSNCFGVDAVGNVRATGTFNASTAADYAEFFEWRDGNLGYEDRVGHFVTLDGDKIRIANADDDYILGIISGKPAILGNSDCDSWNGMYLRDEFGREITEPKPKTELVQLTEEVDDIDPETGEVVGTKTVVTGVAEQEVFDEDGNLVYEGTRPIVNPAYNPEQLYISRADRPEWAAVGMLGVLAVYDDGSCQVNGYCQVADGGIATNDDSIERRYRVVARVTENIIKVVFR